MAEIRNTDLKMVAWELTRSCNLSCAHCRASSEKGPYPGELSAEECFKVIDDIASLASPTIILTGGEPLLRKDLFEIIKYGRGRGLTMVMAPNGTLLDEENIQRIIKSGIKRISVSLDGQDAKAHDDLRNVPGAFDKAVEGIKKAKEAGVEIQINSTITRRNIDGLSDIMELAKGLGAAAYHLFLLVPTGRGKLMENEELSPEQYEEALNLVAGRKKDYPLELKVTCAPHFNRILLQSKCDSAVSLRGRGCMGGTGFCFISHTGDLQPCGYLELKCGNVRREGFKKAWRDSEVFNNIRDFSRYNGKCGVCEFRPVCGGCRARAYAKYGDYLREEPYCVYKPKRRFAQIKTQIRADEKLTRADKELLDALQQDIPFVKKPWQELSARLEMSEKELLEGISALKAKGLIRRIAATIDPKKIGFVSTLIAVKTPPEKSDAVALRLNKYDEITHNYKRDCEYNIWCAAVAPDRSSIENIMRALKEDKDVDAAIELPATRLFKIKVSFPICGRRNLQVAQAPRQNRGGYRAPDSAADAVYHPAEQRINGVSPHLPTISLITQDIPLAQRPFAGLAERLGISEDALLERIASYKASGILRKFAAVLNHRNAGFKYNAMTVWDIPDDFSEKAGRAAASFSAVSHCYLRERRPGWNYNLYSMVHSRTKKACLDTIEEISERIGFNGPKALFSSKEYKKTGVKY